MNYVWNTEIIRKHFHDHQETLCIAVLSIIPLRKPFFFNYEGYFYSRSFKKYSRTSEENSRTFQGYPTIFQFSMTFQGRDDFSRTFKACANHGKGEAVRITRTFSDWQEDRRGTLVSWLWRQSSLSRLLNFPRSAKKKTCFTLQKEQYFIMELAITNSFG